MRPAIQCPQPKSFFSFSSSSQSQLPTRHHPFSTLPQKTKHPRRSKKSKLLVHDGISRTWNIMKVRILPLQITEARSFLVEWTEKKVSTSEKIFCPRSSDFSEKTFSFLTDALKSKGHCMTNPNNFRGNPSNYHTFASSLISPQKKWVRSSNQ